MFHFTSVLFLLAVAQVNWKDAYVRGDKLLSEGKADEAVAELKVAVAGAEASDDGRSSLGGVLDALGRAEHAAGMYRDAKKTFERSVAFWEPHTPALAAGLFNLGNAYQSLREHKLAEQAFRKALEILPASGQIRQQLADALFVQRRYADSQTEARRVILAEPVSSETLAASWNTLALVYGAKGKNAEAVAMFLKSVAILPSGQSRARVLGNLGLVYWKMGDKARALSSLERAAAEMEAVAGSRHPVLGQLLGSYARALEETGQHGLSQQVKQRAHDILTFYAAQTNDSAATVDWRELKF